MKTQTAMAAVLASRSERDSQQGKVWDEKAEHENDLRYESRQDYETTEQGEQI